MKRGEIWWAQVGRKRRPTLIITRSEVIEVRELVTVAEITKTVRGLETEVALEAPILGLVDGSVVNCDGLHTVRRSSLSNRVGVLNDQTMAIVCRAVSYALGC